MQACDSAYGWPSWFGPTVRMERHFFWKKRKIERDFLGAVVWSTFGRMEPGWNQVVATWMGHWQDGVRMAPGWWRSCHILQDGVRMYRCIFNFSITDAKRWVRLLSSSARQASVAKWYFRGVFLGYVDSTTDTWVKDDVSFSSLNTSIRMMPGWPQRNRWLRPGWRQDEKKKSWLPKKYVFHQKTLPSWFRQECQDGDLQIRMDHPDHPDSVTSLIKLEYS